MKRYANHTTSRKKLTQKEQFYSNPLKNTSFFTQPMTHFISKKHKATFEISVVLTMLEPRTRDLGRGRFGANWNCQNKVKTLNEVKFFQTFI